MNKLIVAFAAAAFSLGTIGTASAEQATPPAATGAAQVSETELKNFVVAEKKVSDIQEEYQGKISKVADQRDKALELQQKAQQEMVKAVESSGMEVAQYNQIAQLATVDESLRQRIDKMR